MHHKKLLSTGILILLGLLLSVASISGDTYFNSKSGITFPVPDNWEWLELAKDDREFVEAKFRTSRGNIVIFGSKDLYDYMKSLGMELFSKEDIALKKYRINNGNINNIYEDSSDFGDYEFRTIGKETWLYFESDVFCTYQQSINGNFIMFMSNANIDMFDRKDLEKIIRYVTENELYKEEQNIKNITESKSEAKQKELEEGRTGGIFVILISLAVILLIPKERNAECPVCGEKNSSKNNYCKKCGNKMR